MDIYFYTKIIQNYTGTNIIYTINIETGTYKMLC